MLSFDITDRNIRVVKGSDNNGKVKISSAATVAVEEGYIVNGHVKDVIVTKSVDPLLDKEAVRVISLMPKWIPGKHKGARVDAKYTLPVTFRLTASADEN